ncbi:MAG: ribosomal protein [Bacteroidota bacterium]|jgi:small subunit ribosomal protein S2
MSKVEYKDLLEAGVHFGHLTRKWNPKMAPYIFMERNGIHIIDLNKTAACLEDAQAAIKNIVKSGRKVLFVATKKQAREFVTAEAKRLKMPFVTDRWLGGMLTNFATIRKSLKKMSTIDKLVKDEAYKSIAKREQLTITREREKLERVLGGIADLTRLPAALFVIDAKKEHIAIAEAQRLGIPVFAVVDTNSNPDNVDYVIPGNDDAFKSIAILTGYIGQAIEEALVERKKSKEEDEERAKEDEVAKAQKEESEA